MPDAKLDTPEKPLRLQVFLAHCGLASRRAAEQLILNGRVCVNGTIVRELGTKVIPSDTVLFDGKQLNIEKQQHYIALNKPPFFLCSASDPQNRPLAKDLLSANINERLYNVGRLDFLSSGLILFTNDGGFAAAVGHPSAQIEKEYHVEASGLIPEALLNAFLDGIKIEDVFYRCKNIERTGKRSVKILLIEGKNREIRRVFSYFHLHPKTLCRTRIGAIELGSLPEGKSRPLSLAEIAAMRSPPVEKPFTSN